MSKKKEDILLGQRIKHIREGNNKENKKYTQKDFALELDATVSALSNWENGRNKPNRSMLNKIAILGDITIGELLDIPSKINQIIIYADDLSISYLFDDNVSITNFYKFTDKVDSITKVLGASFTLDMTQETFFPDETEVRNKINLLPTGIYVDKIIYNTLEDIEHKLTDYKFESFHSIKTTMVSIMLRRYLMYNHIELPVQVAIYGSVGGLDGVITIN